MFAVFVALSVPACGGAPAEKKESEDRLAPAPTLTVEAPTLTAPQEDGGGSQGTAPSNPYGPAGEAGCSYGVTGSVLAWVAGPSSWAWIWPDGSLQCTGETAGINHNLGMQLGPMHGPGEYVTAGVSSYSRTWCAQGDMDCTTDAFNTATGEPACVAQVDVAPDTLTIGAKVAGTFRCEQLVGTADAMRTVTVYDGSFWAVMAPPPD
jgi:hypothetical protein